MLQKFVVNKIINLLAKNFELFDVMKYVKEPNELDIKAEKLEKENKKLRKEIKEIKAHLKRLDNIAHPPFFTSEEKANMLDRLKLLEKNKADKNKVL